MTVGTIQPKDIQHCGPRIGQYYDVAILEWIQTFDGDRYAFRGVYTTTAQRLRHDEYLLHNRLIYQRTGKVQPHQTITQLVTDKELAVDGLKTVLLIVTCVAIRQLAETHPDLVLARFTPEEQQQILDETIAVETIDEVDIYRAALNTVWNNRTFMNLAKGD